MSGLMESNLDNMPVRQLGKTGMEVSLLGIGGIPLQRCKIDEVIEILETCQQQGVNLIDSARGYGPSEALIGEALEHLGSRSQWRIATKSMSKDKASMASDIELSLKQFRTAYIDLYQCHFIKDLDQLAQITGPDGAYEALLSAKSQGKIKHIGMTAHNKDVLAIAIESGLWETIQFPFNIVENQGEAVFKRAYELGIGILVMKPLAGGAIDNASLALKYIARNPHITVAIPGMDSVRQVLDNAMAIKSDQPLSDAELANINELKEAMGNVFCRRCGYCGPCAVGIDIPSMFTLEGYLTRYDLKEWATTRYNGLSKHPEDCVECGICETKCPYDLEIRKMLKRVGHHFNTL